MVSSDSPDSASFAKTSSISILAATSNLYQNQIKIPNFNQSPTSLTSIKIALATRTWRSHNSCLNSYYRGTTKYHGRGLLNIPFINCRIQSRGVESNYQATPKKPNPFIKLHLRAPAKFLLRDVSYLRSSSSICSRIVLIFVISKQKGTKTLIKWRT